MNKYDRLEELTKQRKRLMEDKGTAQTLWDLAAERMNQAGADLLDIEDKIRMIEMQIDLATAPMRIVLGGFGPKLTIPSPSYWYQGALNNL
jgi:hypothetical protein